MTLADDELPPSITPRAVMKKEAFLDLVTGGEGLSAAEAALVDATLSTIAEVLESGQGLEIAPLGRLRIIKEKSGRAGHQLLLRLTLDGNAQKGG